MRTFFGLALLVLLSLSGVAARLRPRPADPRKTPIVWASDDNPARRDQIDLYNRRHPDQTLSLDPNNTGLEKVVVQSIAGVGPDCFDAGEGALSVLIDAGIVEDITDDLARRGIVIPRDTWPAVQSIVLRDGRAYGVPTNAAADAIFINKKLFAASGEPIPRTPWTWDELIPVAKRLTLRGPDGKAKRFGLLVDFRQWAGFVIQWGGSVFTPDGTRCVVDSPEAIAGVQFLRDLIYVHKVMPSPVEEAAMAAAGGWGSGTITQFGGGTKGAMALGGRWWLCTLRDRNQFPGLDLTAVESPTHDRRVFMGYGKGTFVNARSPNKEKALDLLAYMMGAEYGQLINDQADGLAPTRTVCYAPGYDRNPKFPEEDYNAVWRSTLETSLPNAMSPFVNSQAANRILNRQLDLVKNDQKSVEAALRDAAREVNAKWTALRRAAEAKAR